MTTQADTLRRITFHITTKDALPLGEQVFISGDHTNLGDWDPAGLPLTRKKDTLWVGTAQLPTSEPSEYKITRGSWATEQLEENGTRPENGIIEPGDKEQIERHVSLWQDTNPPPLPQITGNYRMHKAFHSEFLRYDRTVIVWLPPSYEEKAKQRYPVLYMHDGQQVFDPNTSTHGKDWQVDEWCQQLIKEGKLKELIVVAVYSTHDRYPEYDPAQIGQDYARFMIEELKPFVDRAYRTLSDRKHTAVAGSSLGGTISFYLAWTRPDIYSATACLSPAFKFQDNEFDLELVRDTPKPPKLKIFLSCGQGDDLEKELVEGMREMAELLRAHSFKDKKNLWVVEDPEAQHNEAAWAAITDQWLTFLFGK